MLRGLCSQEAYRALSDCAAAVMWRSRSPSASEATLTGSDLARATGSALVVVSATPSASLGRAVQAVTATAIRPAEMRRPALRRSCGLLSIRRDPISDNTRLPDR